MPHPKPGWPRAGAAGPDDLATQVIQVRNVGATQLLGLIPANWPRWAPRCGINAAPAGRVMDIGGIDNQCVCIDLTTKLH